jgi:hypothetical protein
VIDPENAMLAFEDLFTKLQLLQGEYDRLRTGRGGGSSKGGAAEGVPKNLREILRIQTAVIRLQAWWRKVMVIKRVDREMRISKQTLA